MSPQITSFDHIHPDTPINNKSEDRFRRYGFAQRIADVISNGKYPKSLVLGLYGKWGEGKSSIINCIHSELIERMQQSPEERQPIVIHFNPWIFSDEKQLIRTFFTTIASALGRKLKSNQQKILEVFSRYAEDIGAIVEKFPKISIIGTITKGVTKKIAEDFKKDDSVESLKKKIDDLIVEANVNLIVFIDDIDRLDVTETQLIFKLVKLLADFPRTAYVLAFDDELVAKSLAEKYPSEFNHVPGHTFLEKIIQLPIHIPKADTATLRRFMFELIEEVHSQIKIQLTDREKTRFETYFDVAFLPTLKKPRTAIRFANSIRFTIPLIGKEVNICDLMLVEAIKAFFPDVYQYIRDNPEHFLQKKEYTNMPRPVTPFDKLLEKYQEHRSGLALAIKELLPLTWIDGANSFYEDHAYIEKRICSPKYFHRYFTYAVQQGEMSDIFFESIVKEISTKERNVATDHFKKMIGPDDINTFLYKLSVTSSKISSENLLNVGLVLSSLVESYSSDDEEHLLFKTSEKIVNTIASFLKYHDKKDRHNYVVTIMQNVSQLPTVCAIERGFIHQISETGMGQENHNLITNCHKLIIDRYQRFISENGKLNKLNNSAIWIILNAFHETDKSEVARNIVSAEITNDPQFPLRIIQICTTMNYHPQTPHIYNLKYLPTTKESMEKFYDIEELYNATTRYYGHIKDAKSIDQDKGSKHDILAIEQFQKWYNAGFDESVANVNAQE